MIVWDVSHNAVDKVKEKQAGKGPTRASDKQTENAGWTDESASFTLRL